MGKAKVPHANIDSRTFQAAKSSVGFVKHQPQLKFAHVRISFDFHKRSDGKAITVNRVRGRFIGFSNVIRSSIKYEGKGGYFQGEQEKRKGKRLRKLDQTRWFFFLYFLR